MGKIVTVLSNERSIESFGLTQEQHDIAVKMIENNAVNEKYSLSNMEPEIRDFYIENSHRDKDYEYEEFMRDARSSNALIYVFIFNDGFSEMLGDVVVKDKRCSMYRHIGYFNGIDAVMVDGLDPETIVNKINDCKLKFNPVDDSDIINKGDLYGNFKYSDDGKYLVVYSVSNISQNTPFDILVNQDLSDEYVDVYERMLN